jgi:hypothetical protein
MNGLVAWYLFNQNTTDSSGNGNNGTGKGNFYIDPNNEGVFDGTGSRVVVPDSPSLEITGGLTVGARVNTNTTTGYQDLIAKSFNTGYRLRLYNNTGVPQLILGNNGTTASFFGATAVPAGTRTHVAATVSFNGSTATVKFYINGILDATRTQTNFSAITAGTGALVLGAATDGTSEPFNGIEDSVVVYNRTLSDTEVLAVSQDPS